MGFGWEGHSSGVHYEMTSFYLRMQDHTQRSSALEFGWHAEKPVLDSALFSPSGAGTKH